MIATGDDDIRAKEVIPARRVVHVIHVNAERGFVGLGEDGRYNGVLPVPEEEVGHRAAVHPFPVIADKIHDLIFSERERIEVFRNFLEHLSEGGVPQKHEAVDPHLFSGFRGPS